MKKRHSSEQIVKRLREAEAKIVEGRTVEDVCLDRVGQAFHQERELASRALLGVRLALALLGEEVVVPGDIEMAVPKVSFGDGDQPLPIFNAAAHS